jgi:hypothetical protein
MKIAVAGLAAVSIGLNVYQYMNNRGLKLLLATKGVSTVDQCDILKRAVSELEGEVSGLKAELNLLIDDITAGKVAPNDVPERIMNIYRKASKAPEGAAPAESPKSDEAATPANNDSDPA